MLSFENVALSRQKTVVLEDISFVITPGEIVAILGASGAGKSSIFRLLIGEMSPTLGSIRLDDFLLRDLSSSSLQLYRRQIGVIFQDFRLLPQKTVFENIAFALQVCGEESLIMDRVPELIDLVGLKDQAHRFPRELSGGEKQRVAIARALVHDPKILLADEPTGNLDPKNSREIGEIFKKLSQEKGLTLLFATHDPLLVQKLNPRVIRLEKGKVQFDERRCPLEKAFAGII
jgi:cell division transport system ATP-binding protein